MIMSKEKKDLDYWKKNAEEDYMQVPISVLRYISELEEVLKLLTIPDNISCSCDNGIIVCPGCDGEQSKFGICAGCSGRGAVTCGKCGGKNKI